MKTRPFRCPTLDARHSTGRLFAHSQPEPRTVNVALRVYHAPKLCSKATINWSRLNSANVFIEDTFWPDIRSLSRELHNCHFAVTGRPNALDLDLPDEVRIVQGGS